MYACMHVSYVRTYVYVCIYIYINIHVHILWIYVRVIYDKRVKYILKKIFDYVEICILLHT